jgi:hypothetical protein
MNSWAVMLVEFEGVITNSSVNVDPFGFGTGVGVLNGRTVTGSFLYDPDLAPPDSDPSATNVLHQTTADSEVWFSIPEVYIDGVPVPVPDFDLFLPNSTTDRAIVGLKDQVNLTDDVVEYSRTLFQALDGSNFHQFGAGVPGPGQSVACDGL